MDLGDLGPREGEASFYEWRWSYSAPLLLPWLVLLVSIVGIRANRDRRAWLILVPLMIVNLSYLLLKKIGDTDYTLVIKGNTVVSIDPPGINGPLYQRSHCRENHTPWISRSRFLSEENIVW